ELGTGEGNCVGSDAPHSLQNFASRGFSAPHDVQRRASGEPQLLQNFAPSRLSKPQPAQRMPPLYSFGKGNARGSKYLLLPWASKRSRRSMVMSALFVSPCEMSSAANRATPGPHIMPAPPAVTAKSPFTPGTSSMIG